VFADPGAECPEELRLTEVSFTEKTHEFRERKKGECFAAFTPSIGAATGQQLDREILSIPAPHFRDTERRVDSHAIESAPTDLNFQRQVRRWVLIQIDVLATADDCFVLNPVRFIRFQPAGFFFRRYVVEPPLEMSMPISSVSASINRPSNRFRFSCLFEGEMISSSPRSYVTRIGRSPKASVIAM
jgi:hypothetical protein